MRKQVRPPKPDVLRIYGEQWNRQWIQLRHSNPAAKFAWYKTEGKSARDWLLPVLNAMTQGHCSFCDTFPLEDRSKTPIEHFKPKSRPEFYQHAYDWENLFYCCELCQNNKGEKWDELLLRPDELTYEFDSYFMFDFTTGELMPSILADQNGQERARKTIELFGLDSPERRRFRRLASVQFLDSSIPVLDDWPYRNFLCP